jgi:hypothetical protein
MIPASAHKNPSRRETSKALADASKVKTTEIPLDQYHHLLRKALRLDALERNGVVEWCGYESAFDGIYDDACIEKLPVEFLD